MSYVIKHKVKLLILCNIEVFKTKFLKMFCDIQFEIIKNFQE